MAIRVRIYDSTGIWFASQRIMDEEVKKILNNAIINYNLSGQDAECIVKNARISTDCFVHIA